MEPVYFVTAKLSLHILGPVNLMIFLVLFGLYAQWMKWARTAKLSIGIGITMLTVLMLWPIGDPMIAPLEKRFPRPVTLPKVKDVAGIVVLGGGEDLVRSLSWGTPNVTDAGERFLTAAWLARRYPHVPVIFVGGQIRLKETDGRRYDPDTELAWLLLRQAGVPASRIRTVRGGETIYGQIRALAQHVKQRPLLSRKIRRRYGIRGNRLILITSAYQMPRAMGVVQKQRLSVTPYPVDYRSRHGRYRYIDFFFSDHLRTFEPAVQEWVALTVYYLTGRTSGWFPKP